MLRSGAAHLKSLRDGRRVYIGGERVDDVTTHAAFRNAARTIAGIYDAKAAPENRDLLTCEEEGVRCSAWFLRARNRDDLARRMRAHRAVADMTYGMFGRSPDHVASFVTGMMLHADKFGRYADNLRAYWRHLRDRDLYAVYAVVPPQAVRNPDFYEKSALPIPTLEVVRQDDDGVVISGMKMLATGAVFANEIWIGNLIPLAPGQSKQAITCAVPCNAPGLSLWSRKPLERSAPNAFENPLASRFDESDCMLLCEDVHVPWERVFVHDDPLLARAIYVDTAGHNYGNHQSNVRFAAKLQLLVGVAARIAQASGADQVPAVRETLGRLAAQEATMAAMIAGQIQDAEEFPQPGWWCFNRRYVYAALNWATENHSALIDAVRELCGGSVFQMPADISVLDDPELRHSFERYWATPQRNAIDRMKLYKLAWDLTGSEFAGRHLQYEKFYAGASFIVRNYSYTHADWDRFHATVDGLLAATKLPTQQ